MVCVDYHFDSSFLILFEDFRLQGLTNDLVGENAILIFGIVNCDLLHTVVHFQ